MNLTPEHLALDIVNHIWSDLGSLSGLGQVKFNMTRQEKVDLITNWQHSITELVAGADNQRKYLGFFDGSAKPNPGNMSIGGYIQDPNHKTLYKYSISLGKGTNNTAEYMSLIHILQECNRRGIQRILIRGDSQLIINQVTETWKVKDPKMRQLCDQAQEAKAKMSNCDLMWQPRKQNAEADKLANNGHGIPTDKGRLIA